MSASATYRGLVPRDLSGGAYMGAIRQYRLTANTATGIFTGDIVNVGAVVLTPVAATPTTTRNGNTPQGIVVGVTYYDGTNIRKEPFLPANGYTSFSAYGPIIIEVIPNPDITFMIQANGSVAATAVGKNAALAFGTGSSSTGLSVTRLDQATIATTNTLAVRIVAIPDQDIDGGTNAAGDTYTWVLAQWNAGVHADRNATGV